METAKKGDALFLFFFKMSLLSQLSLPWGRLSANLGVVVTGKREAEHESPIYFRSLDLGDLRRKYVDKILPIQLLSK